MREIHITEQLAIHMKAVFLAPTFRVKESLNWKTSLNSSGAFPLSFTSRNSTSCVYIN